MNQLDQRLYKLRKNKNGFVDILEGGRCVGQILTTFALARLILADYLGITTKNLNVNREIIVRLSSIFYTKVFHEGVSVNSCSVCGITVKECLNGPKRSKAI